MNNWFLLLISTMLLLSTLMVIQSHITRVIKLLIAQNLLLSVYLFTEAIYISETEFWITFIITVVVKILILPWLLWKLTGFLKLSGRIDPILNKPTLLLLTVGLVLFALILGQNMVAVLPHPNVAGFSLALANAFIAILLIIFRRKTVTQVIGLLVLENSIFILAAALNIVFPWLIELGMSFDVLIGFMIFALFLIRIQREYGSFQVHHFEKLKERI